MRRRPLLRCRVGWNRFGGGAWTHAGIVLRLPGPGAAGGAASARAFVLESTLVPLAQGCDVIEGALPSRLNGALRIYPLVGRAMAYDGDVSLLPLRAALPEAAEDALLRAATFKRRDGARR